MLAFLLVRIHIVPLEDLGSRLPDMILWTCAGASGNKTAVVSSESVCVCVAFNIGKTSQPVYLGDAGKFAGRLSDGAAISCWCCWCIASVQQSVMKLVGSVWQSLKVLDTHFSAYGGGIGHFRYTVAAK